jgi:tetratricopeptide (TPR) repeat protein
VESSTPDIAEETAAGEPAADDVPVSAAIPDEFISGGGGLDFPESDGDEDFSLDTGTSGMPFGDTSAGSFEEFNLDAQPAPGGVGPEGEGSLLADGDKPPGDFKAGKAADRKDKASDLEEFSLPGIDDVIAGVVGTAGGKKTGTRMPGVVPSDEVEEIRLSDGDLVNLQKTLTGYPLNLRVACEELIAEEAVIPEQMSQLIKLLVRGAAARETADLAGKILGRTIPVSRSFEKKTGAELEEEQSSFAYIFVHNFLPVLRLFLIIAVMAASVFYLSYQFIYTPLRAESIYKLGYERIGQGEYERANERFTQAFGIHRVKDWFYKYAEAFRDQRQYRYAEEKYDELLRFYPRDKKGALDYAALETNYLRNYEKADSLLRRYILDYEVNDYDALLAAGDNALAWGEIDYDRYEDARFSYARLLDQYGQTDPVMERMMKYFIRTDNLKEALPLQYYFMNYPKRKISGVSLAELGGYLLDKRTEEVRGVPNEYVEQIQGVRDVLLRAVGAEPALPEGHYHLSRYYRNLNSLPEEQAALETAIRAFDQAGEESVRRLGYRIAAQQRCANILTGQRRFFDAEDQLVKGIGLYEDGLTRRLLNPSPEYGRLYADLGDLEYFTKAGDMEMALQYYLRSERNGWAPPEIQYRMGAAYYRQEQWPQALERFFAASSDLPLNRRLLLALGNVTYQRGDYFAAQGYYNRLLDILEGERSRLPQLMPNERPEYIDLAERLMIARNNTGVTLEAISRSQGSLQPRVLDRYRSRALGLYTESARAWDSLTRNPDTMVRLGADDLATPGINLAFLNSRNALYPVPDYEPQLYLQHDTDVLEPSIWEELSPQAARLTE